MISTAQRFAIAMLFFFNATNVVAGPYDGSANRAADWLRQQRSLIDGSWGANDDVRYLHTSEAVFALAALNRRSIEYYGGLTWLENHAASNIDFKARRVLALQGNGDNVANDIQYMQTVPSLSVPGNSGWGLSALYQASPLDTALTLLALQQAGISIPSDALTYLKSSQLTGANAGWALGQEIVGDPVTTAHVLRALIVFSSVDPTLGVPIASGLAALNGMVTSTSPVTHQSLAAFAMLRYDPMSSQAGLLLNSLIAAQGIDGSWGNDIYATALAIQALAAGMGSDLATQRINVAITDANLRSAINLALGRNALDSLNRGELGQLTSLDISNRGITTLTGLEFAINLTYLNASNNNISSFAPIAGLTQLTTALKANNPGAPPPAPAPPRIPLEVILMLLLED